MTISFARLDWLKKAATPVEMPCYIKFTWSCFAAN